MTARSDVCALWPNTARKFSPFETGVQKIARHLYDEIWAVGSGDREEFPFFSNVWMDGACACPDHFIFQFSFLSWACADIVSGGKSFLYLCFGRRQIWKRESLLHPEK